jgi:hypothetical protein
VNIRVSGMAMVSVKVLCLFTVMVWVRDMIGVFFKLRVRV